MGEREVEERRESGENRSKYQGRLRGIWCWVRAPPCGPHGPPPGSAEPGRKRDMSSIFHTVNKMILPCRVNTQPPIVISPKYTHARSHTHTHNRISAELYLATAYKQNFFPPPVLHKTTCVPALKKKHPCMFMPGYTVWKVKKEIPQNVTWYVLLTRIILPQSKAHLSEQWEERVCEPYRLISIN